MRWALWITVNSPPKGVFDNIVMTATVEIDNETITLTQDADKSISIHSLSSPAWEAIPSTGAIMNGTKIYPEKPNYNGNVQNTVYLTMTIDPKIPAGRTGTAHYHIFDPKNEKWGETPTTGTDNFGSIDKWKGTWTFAGGENAKKETLTFTKAQPGDNYITVAYPSDQTKVQISGNDEIKYSGSLDPWGESLNFDTVFPGPKSTKLTVWRHFNVEHDWLKGYSNADTALLVSEFASICITVSDMGGHDANDPKKQEFELPQFVSEIFDVFADVNTVRNQCRDTRFANLQSSNDYWYQQMVRINKFKMAIGSQVNVVTINFNANNEFEWVGAINTTVTPVLQERALGINLGPNGFNNLIFISNGALTSFANTVHPTHKVALKDVNGVQSIYDYVYPDELTLRKDTFLHEVIHSFGIADNDLNIFDIMTYGYSSSGTVGYLDNGTKTINFNTTTYPILHVDHIKRIQSTPKPL